MKNMIRKMTGLLLASLVLFISCAGQVDNSADDKKDKKKDKIEINFITEDVDYNIQTMAAALGDVNKIVDSEGNEVTGTGAVNRSAARFTNGAELYMTYPYKLYYYAYLVEYNDFTNSDVLNWMETNEFNSVTDCSFSQQYKGVTIDPQKKYVEVCSYLDSNNKAIYSSIRIHYPRADKDTDDKGYFYGIECCFDPEFKIDTNAGKDIKTKEEAIYVYGDGWNEGENPWSGKKFKFINFEVWENGVKKSEDPDRNTQMVFKDDVVVFKQGEYSGTCRYFWNTKYKLVYLLDTGAGVPNRWELDGNQLKITWGAKSSWTNGDGELCWTELYNYTYYELIQ